MKTHILNFLLAGLMTFGCTGVLQAQALTELPEASAEAQEPAEVQPVSEQTSRSVVMRDGGTYYCGDQQMNGAAYKRFLETECPQAFQQYKQGQQCMIAGWTLLGFGVVGMPVAFVGWMVSGFGVVVSDAANKEEPADPKMVAINGTFTALGLVSAASVISSVPLLAVGYTRMHKSVDTYNELCLQPQQPSQPDATAVELSLGMTGNGVGMTVRF